MLRSQNRESRSPLVRVLRGALGAGLCALVAGSVALAPASAEAGGRRHSHRHHARDHGHHRGPIHVVQYRRHADVVPWLAFAAVSIAMIDAAHEHHDGCSHHDGHYDDRHDDRHHDHHDDGRR